MDVLITLLLFVLPVLFLLSWRRRGSSSKLPPGSLGFPIIGQSIGMLRAMKTNTGEKWLRERVSKYGPISKLTLFGKETVFIHGQAANKFIFHGDSNVLSNKQTPSVRAIMGDRNLLELTDQDHKRVRESILRPESLKQYVGKMDEEVVGDLFIKQITSAAKRCTNYYPIIRST